MNITKLQNFNVQFKQQDKNTKKNAVICVSAAAIASPLLTFIDGDNIKKTYKNRSVLKYTTGLCAIGGLGMTGKILTDKYTVEPSNPHKNKIIRNSVLGAVILPLLLLVENWAQVDKKPIAKKWYPISIVSGALIGGISAKINQK